MIKIDTYKLFKLNDSKISFDEKLFFFNRSSVFDDFISNVSDIFQILIYLSWEELAKINVFGSLTIFANSTQRTQSVCPWRESILSNFIFIRNNYDNIIKIISIITLLIFIKIKKRYLI